MSDKKDDVVGIQMELDHGVTTTTHSKIFQCKYFSQKYINLEHNVPLVPFEYLQNMFVIIHLLVSNRTKCISMNDKIQGCHEGSWRQKYYYLLPHLLFLPPSFLFLLPLFRVLQGIESNLICVCYQTTLEEVEQD
eukprot:467013_1